MLFGNAVSPFFLPTTRGCFLPWGFVVVRVIEHYGFSKVCSVQVCIDFGGDDTAVSHHVFDCYDICSAFYQFGGKTMPEGMGVYVFGYACRLGCLFYHHKGVLSCEFFASVVEKDIVFVFVVGRDVAEVVVNEVSDVFKCCLANRNKSFLVAFTQYLYILKLKEDVAFAKVQ